MVEEVIGDGVNMEVIDDDYIREHTHNIDKKVQNLKRRKTWHELWLVEKIVKHKENGKNKKGEQLQESFLMDVVGIENNELVSTRQWFNVEDVWDTCGAMIFNYLEKNKIGWQYDELKERMDDVEDETIKKNSHGYAYPGDGPSNAIIEKIGNAENANETPLEDRYFETIDDMEPSDTIYPPEYNDGTIPSYFTLDC